MSTKIYSALVALFAFAFASSVFAAPQTYTVGYSPNSKSQPMPIDGSTMNVSVYSGTAPVTKTQATPSNGQMTVNHNHHNQAVAKVTSFEEQPNNVKCQGASDPGGSHIPISCRTGSQNKIRNFISR